MNLSEYFENISGTGVLGTTNKEGLVNMAIYARPHVIEEDKCVFIMTDKTSRQNLLENPNAAYLFKEEADYQGVRFNLKKIKESEDRETIHQFLRRAQSTSPYEGEKTLFAVYFSISNIRPLI